jgi:hypothetical protein
MFRTADQYSIVASVCSGGRQLGKGCLELYQAVWLDTSAFYSASKTTISCSCHTDPDLLASSTSQYDERYCYLGTYKIQCIAYFVDADLQKTAVGVDLSGTPAQAGCGTLLLPPADATLNVFIALKYGDHAAADHGSTCGNMRDSSCSKATSWAGCLDSCTSMYSVGHLCAIVDSHFDSSASSDQSAHEAAAAQLDDAGHVLRA